MPTEPRSRMPLVLLLLAAGGVLCTCLCLGVAGAAYYVLGGKTDRAIVLNHIRQQHPLKGGETIEWGDVIYLKAGEMLPETVGGVPIGKPIGPPKAVGEGLYGGGTHGSKRCWRL